MKVLEYEVAAIYYFIQEIIGIKYYFDEVPKDFLVPCVFYPTPTFETDSFSTSSFSTTFTMYAKVIDISNVSAAWKASEIIQAVCKNRNKIPLVNESGKKTGKNFRIDNLISKKIDEGVVQIAFTWKRYTKYTKNTAILAREFFFNGSPVGINE